MENKKEFLNEENYQRGKKKLTKIALIVLVVGVLIGGSLITTGLIKQSKINSQYSEESKAAKLAQLEGEKKQLTEDLQTEKQNLIASKTTLENKIKPIEDQIKKLEREKTDVFMNGGFNDKYYEIEDKIEELEESIEADQKTINTIEDALDDSFDHCSFYDAKNNTYTSKYCSLKNQISKKVMEIATLDSKFSDFNKQFDSHDSIPFYMIGAFIIISTCMIAGSIYMIAKRREITAFTIQQTMPLAQEGIEKMAPTIGKAGADIAKEMAPVYGDIAKEISKGIKEGINEADKNK